MHMTNNQQLPIKKEKIVRLPVNPAKYNGSVYSDKGCQANVSVNQQPCRIQLVEGPSTASALILLRLNEMDTLADAFGLEVAFELSIQVITKLKSCLRTKDILERVSSNEITVILADAGSQRDVERLMDRIEQECTGQYFHANLKLHLSVTAGIFMVYENDASFEEYFRYARIALRQVEQSSASSYRFFSPKMMYELQYQSQVVYELCQALKYQRFVLHYQPQFSVDQQQIIAVEALLRVKGQDGELIYPDRFMDIAEKTGLIVQIGYWVISEACHQYKIWQQLGCAPRYIAINISAQQLADKSLITIIDAAVQRSGIDYTNLELEITENSVIKDIKHAQKVLTALREKGVRIALDDFGTGFSSFAYLEQLPFDVIKIDRSFLYNWYHQKRSGGMIKSMIGMARELEMDVVVEGVENFEQKEFIQTFGKLLGQGYCYSYPRSAEDASEMLKEAALVTC